MQCFCELSFTQKALEIISMLRLNSATYNAVIALQHSLVEICFLNSVAYNAFSVADTVAMLCGYRILRPTQHPQLLQSWILFDAEANGRFVCNL